MRDGEKAVASAKRACEIREWKEPHDLATLAASYAEIGDFTRAVYWQTKANSLFTDEPNRKDGLRRLGLYKANQPLRD